MDRRDMERLSQPVIDIYNNIEAGLLDNIAKRLDGKKDLLETDPEAWKLQMAENLGVLDKENARVIQSNTNLKPEELNAILLNAGLEGVTDNEEEMERALEEGADLIEPQPVNKSPQITAILTAYQSQAMDTFNLTNQTLLDQSNRVYQQILDQTVASALTGYYTGEEALRSTIVKWADNGVPALIDKSGRQWGTEGYVRTVMRSTISNTVNEMQDKRMEEYGVDLVEISSHAGARPKCEPYQGRIFSLRPGHEKYDYIGDTSMGEPDGLFGINCGHNKYPFVEGISEQTYRQYDKEENDRIYKESQEQRGIERNIRKAKTRKRMLEQAGDNEGANRAQKLISKRQEEMRNFANKTGRTRRRGREQIVNPNAKDNIPNPKPLAG